MRRRYGGIVRPTKPALLAPPDLDVLGGKRHPVAGLLHDDLDDAAALGRIAGAAVGRFRA